MQSFLDCYNKTGSSYSTSNYCVDGIIISLFWFTNGRYNDKCTRWGNSMGEMNTVQVTAAGKRKDTRKKGKTPIAASRPPTRKKQLCQSVSSSCAIIFLYGKVQRKKASQFSQDCRCWSSLRGF